MKLFLFVVCATVACAAVTGSVRGVVHDPDHRPMQGAQVVLKSATSDFQQTTATAADGSFEITAVPVGAYQVTGLARRLHVTVREHRSVASGASPVLHFQLLLSTIPQTVTVSEQALAVNPEQMTPSTIVSRKEIQMTPGADLTNSLSMITNYVPGAWMTHDQLHVRGGHQVTWAIDGVPIPNTNIASNVGPQLDPKDIDYLEAQRGGYSAAYGDRTYGVFNVVPRTGFERNNDAELVSTFGTFFQTNDQASFGVATRKSSATSRASMATAARLRIRNSGSRKSPAARWRYGDSAAVGDLDL